MIINFSIGAGIALIIILICCWAKGRMPKLLLYPLLPIIFPLFAIGLMIAHISPKYRKKHGMEGFYAGLIILYFSAMAAIFVSLVVL